MTEPSKTSSYNFWGLYSARYTTSRLYPNHNWIQRYTSQSDLHRNYLRNQIDYFAGFYQINLLLGYPVQNIESVYRALEKNDYIKLKLPLKVKFWFDYYKQIKLIKKIFDIENKDIICRSYDENRNKLIESFLEIINVDNKNSDYENYKNINQSITSLSVSMLEYFNQNRDKFNLSNKETSDIKNILVNRNIFKGEKFSQKIDMKIFSCLLIQVLHKS